MSPVNPAGGSGLKEGRGSWVTPRWFAEQIGAFDIDPCSNPRSHIRAKIRLQLEAGDDGLLECHGAGWYRSGEEEVRADGDVQAFVNPPYANGQVIRWVRHWKHTRFAFLLRWDPSTQWFAELFPHCTHVLFPYRRINFEPPPGVTASSNAYPHALFLRGPTTERLGLVSALGYRLSVDTVTPLAQGNSYARISEHTLGGA